MPKVLVSEAAALSPAAGLSARRSGCCCVAAAVWLQARLADAFTMRRSSPESRDRGSTLTHTEAVVAPSSAAACTLEAVNRNPSKLAGCQKQSCIYESFSIGQALTEGDVPLQLRPMLNTDMLRHVREPPPPPLGVLLAAEQSTLTPDMERSSLPRCCASAATARRQRQQHMLDGGTRCQIVHTHARDVEPAYRI